VKLLLVLVISLFAALILTIFITPRSWLRYFLRTVFSNSYE